MHSLENYGKLFCRPRRGSCRVAGKGAGTKRSLDPREKRLAGGRLQRFHRRITTHQTVLVVGLPLALAVLVGCAPRRPEISLPLEPPDAFSETGNHPAPNRWWTAFDDPELNQAVDQALQANFDLETAWQRLREARAIATREAASLYPDLNGQLGGEINGSDEGENGEAFRLGLVSEYEVDLWGRISSSVEAARLRAEGSRADFQTAALTLSAEVARSWFQLTVARQQLDLLQEQVATNADLLTLLTHRFGSGQIRRADILRQRQLLESTREELLAAESRVAVGEHQLAVLLGQPPRQAGALATGVLPSLPPLPATGLPAELVQRRPDVERDFLQLQAADKDLAVAISNRYPRLSLTASLSIEDENAADLFDDWGHALAANVVAPLFDAGERRAEVERSEAVKQQLLFTYGQTILTAFQEVEDALVQEAKQLEQIERIEEQIALAEETYQQLQLEYLNGVSDYLDVLTSLTDAQQLRRDLLSANLALLEFRIALYRALAGGFETEKEL